MKSLGLIISLLLLAGSSFCDKKANCDNPCQVCQKTIYQLKFKKSAGCKHAKCKSTCNKVWSLWNRPRSPLASFNANTVGKCDACFRAGFCSVSECSAQKALEKTVISQIVNKAKLNGFVDSSIMNKLMKRIMKNKKVNFKKYAKKVKKTLKTNLKNKKFRASFKKVSASLKLLANAASPKDVKAAIKSVNKALSKAKTSKSVKGRISKIAASFQALVSKKKATGKGKSKKVVRAAKKIKRTLKTEAARIAKYLKRLKAAKSKVRQAVSALNNKATLSDKTKGKLNKLQVLLNNLRNVVKTLKETQAQIQNTLGVIKAAIAQYKN